MLVTSEVVVDSLVVVDATVVVVVGPCWAELTSGDQPMDVAIARATPRSPTAITTRAAR
ncbi:MAG: hypothetical protein ACJ739_00030 [Acidimicrobiales bacterium]